MIFQTSEDYSNTLFQHSVTFERLKLSSMDYINIFIPLAGGILFLSYPELLLPVKDRVNEKKKKLLKLSGYLLITVAVGYFILELSKP